MQLPALSLFFTVAPAILPAVGIPDASIPSPFLHLHIMQWACRVFLIALGLDQDSAPKLLASAHVVALVAVFVNGDTLGFGQVRNGALSLFQGL